MNKYKLNLHAHTRYSEGRVSIKELVERIWIKEKNDYILVETDPKGFLDTYNKNIIFDEIQRVPKLFSYLQEIVDSDNISGRYILTGSNNFLLLDKITKKLNLNFTI